MIKINVPPIIKGRHILKGDAYDEAWTAYVSDPAWAHVSKTLLNAKEYRLKQTEQTYRTINHWSEVGIIAEIQREDGKGWRKFSIIDLTWIHVVSQMRNFGVSLGEIMMMQSTLFKKLEGYPLFEIYIVRGMDDPSYVIVFEDGKAALATKSELEQTERWCPLDDHIRINLNRAFERAFRATDGEYGNYKPLSTLNAEEWRIIMLVRGGEYESVTIKLKNGKVEHYELEKVIDAKIRIIDLLNTNDFQDIDIKQRDGNVVSIKSKIKLRVTEDLRASSTKLSQSSKSSKQRADDSKCLPSKNAENI